MLPALHLQALQLPPATVQQLLDWLTAGPCREEQLQAAVEGVLRHWFRAAADGGVCLWGGAARAAEVRLLHGDDHAL